MIFGIALEFILPIEVCEYDSIDASGGGKNSKLTCLLVQLTCKTRGQSLELRPKVV